MSDAWIAPDGRVVTWLHDGGWLPVHGGRHDVAPIPPARMRPWSLDPAEAERSRRRRTVNA